MTEYHLSSQGKIDMKVMGKYIPQMEKVLSDNEV